MQRYENASTDCGKMFGILWNQADEVGGSMAKFNPGHIQHKTLER